MTITFADVGARGTLPDHWLKSRHQLQVIGFEPDVEEWQRLVQARPQARMLNVALSREPGALPLYVTRSPGLTSIFRPNRPFIDQFPNAGRFDVLDERQVQADTLDCVRVDQDLPEIDVLKIDTQGSELYVLQGAAETLASAIAVEIEIEYVPIYLGQPLLPDVDAFLRAFGFVLAHIEPVTWTRMADKSQHVVWADAVYLKRGVVSEKARAIAAVYGCGIS